MNEPASAGTRAAPPPDPAAGFAQAALYSVVRLIVWLVARTYWGLRITGRHHVPERGAFIVAPVHRSYIDTLVVSTLSRRRFRYMGKAELWTGPRWTRWVLSALGGFPVHRGGADREALRRCIDVIERGEPLVIFPEGTRREGPVVEEIFEGAAYVAARTGVPIVPVGLAGTDRIMPKGAKGMRPGRSRLVVGEPLPAPAGADGSRPPRSAVRETTRELHDRLQALFDEARAQL